MAGELKGRRIRVPERGVRPTSDRTREAVFDVLGPSSVLNARVLDLYAGTGALGIEALSRGAVEAHFVEGSRDVARTLRENLELLDLSKRGAVHEADLSRIELPPGAKPPFDLVFLDPPYAGNAGALWLERLAQIPWPPDGGLVVYERRKGTEVLAPKGFEIRAERTYSDTTVTFYRALTA